MEAERDAHVLEDRMRANEQRLWVEEQQRRRVEEDQRWAEAAEITKNLMADETKELDRLLVKVISQPTKETSK